MTITCDFCWRMCTLKEGQKGVCAVRSVIDGKLVSLNWGNVVAMGVDPVEKKPLYHFRPGHRTLSFALFGCNLSCSFCQNYSISQKEYYGEREGVRIEVQEIVQEALVRNCPSISFTYSEPLVWQDYLIEVATLAKKEGLSLIMVSNGTFSEAALERLLPFIDAFNIDLKGDEEFYRSVCKGSAEPVLRAIEAITEYGSHLEVTTMVTAEHHTPAVMQDLGEQLHLRGVKIWHLTRYFPHYHSHQEATQERYLKRTITAMKRIGIPFVYPGNSTLDASTYCPGCKTKLIGRTAYQLSLQDGVIEAGQCLRCGTPIVGDFPL